MIIWNIIRVAIAAVIIVAVAELSKRFPRYGALLLSLPTINVLAFLFSWFQYRDLPAIAKLANETLILVLLDCRSSCRLYYRTNSDWDSGGRWGWESYWLP